MFTNIAQNRYEPDQGYRQLSQIALPPELISESGNAYLSIFIGRYYIIPNQNAKLSLLFRKLKFYYTISDVQ